MTDPNNSDGLAETAALREQLADQAQAATDRVAALLVPIQAKVREHKTQERAEHRRAVLREITSRLANRAHLYGDGRTVNEVIRDLLALAGAPHLEQPVAAEPSDRPRLFHLQRDRDVSGVSGTGRVAWGVLWPDGTVSLRWTGERPSTVTWDRLADAEHVHGHGGATRIVWADEQAAVTRAVVLLAAVEELEQYVGRQSSSADPAVEGARLVIRQLRRMADETASTVGSFFRDGFGADEIAELLDADTSRRTTDEQQ